MMSVGAAFEERNPSCQSPRRSHPNFSETSSIRPTYQSPPPPALAPIESCAVLSIRPMVVVDV